MKTKPAAKKKLVETLWAVRIGTFRQHYPYFMLGENGVSLSDTRGQAVAARGNVKGAIVRVRVTEI